MPAATLSRMAPVSAASPFGSRLRRWRRMRGLSQLALATEASTTARHLSFLETGRSRPSRAMVLRLSEVLGLPLRERNRLLEAAGLAPAYHEAGLDSEALAPFRSAIANWPEVARAGLARVRDRARQAPQDDEFADLVTLAEAALGQAPAGDAPEADLIVCPEFVAGDRVIRTLGMAARFDSVLEVTLDELRIELMYPADDDADAFFRGAR